MLRRLIALGVIAVIVLVVVAPRLRGAEEAGKNPPVPPKAPELKVLDRLIGSWDQQVVMRPSEGMPGQARVTATATLTREWVLDGRFVQEKSKDSNGLESVILFGYDTARPAYRIWYFNSTGWATDWRAQWNEGAQTLLFRGDWDKGVVFTATIRFIDADTQEWTNTIKDAAGKVLSDVSGKCTRRK